MRHKALFAEAAGTFILCLLGAGATMADAALGSRGPGLLGVALASGLALGVAVSATMSVSGGHVNPAVTIALLATGRMRAAGAAQYVAAQLAGAALAGVLLSNVVFKHVRAPGVADVRDLTWNGTPRLDVSQLAGAPAVSPEGQPLPGGASRRLRAQWRGVLIEGLLTFPLVFVVFATAIDPRRPQLGGLAIGLTWTAAILVGGPLTGAALNPARVFGTGLAYGAEFWAQHWVYWIGPVGGALLAAFTYEYLLLDRSAQR